MLIDYLSGETDNTPKSPKFLFNMYMALMNLAAAAKVALTIANAD